MFKLFKQLIFSLILTAISQLAFSGNDIPLGAKSQSLSGNSIFLKEVWSSANNPALLSEIDGFHIGLNYANQFILNELSTKSIGFALSKENQGFGISFSQFGFSLYNENRLGLSYGMKLSDRFNAGVELIYLSTVIGDDYGSNSGISATIGLHAVITDKLHTSAVLINPNRLKLSEFQDERYPTLLKLGLAYEFSEKVQLMSEYVKDIDLDGDFRLGLDYQFNSTFSFQTGFSTFPSSFSFGFGVSYNNFDFNLSSAYDQLLGFSPQLSLVFIPNRKKGEE